MSVISTFLGLLYFARCPFLQPLFVVDSLQTSSLDQSKASYPSATKPSFSLSSIPSSPFSPTPLSPPLRLLKHINLLGMYCGSRFTFCKPFSPRFGLNPRSDQPKLPHILPQDRAFLNDFTVRCTLNCKPLILCTERKTTSSTDSNPLI